MCAKEKKEQELEWQRGEFFKKLCPMAPTQQWNAKVVSEALKESGIST
jgi:ubiquinone biosynthesis protein COQ9